MKSRILTIFFILTLLLPIACNRTIQPAQPTGLSSAEPAVTPITPVPTYVTATPAAGAPASPTVEAANPSSPTASWDDRSIFRANLTTAAQTALDQLPGASVYHIDIRVADDFSSLQGQQQVHYTNRENQSLDAIYFQLFPNMSGGKSTVSNTTVDGQPVEPVYESENSTVRLPLPTPLQPGQSTVIQLDFQVEIPKEYGGNYGLFGYLKDILVLDGFYPAIPVYDEQGWHAGQVPPNADTTFQDASFYVVRVTAPAALTIVASGVQVDRSEANGSQTVTFAAGPARDFYMAASDKFTVISQKTGPNGETTVNSYASKYDAQGAQTALDAAVKTLQSNSTHIGPYPYTEFDVVSTPMQGALGIEYPGMVGVNLDLYNPNLQTAGVPNPVMLESTVAHEVGHQWFYNVVGNDQANQPWLDESLTQYITGFYFLDNYSQNGLGGWRASWTNRWKRVDEEKKPIGLPAGDYQGSEYSAIVYGRGPLFIEALSEKMGPQAFDQFLRDYYKTNQWGIATEAEFKQEAEQHCGCDLDPLFAEWVDPQ